MATVPISEMTSHDEQAVIRVCGVGGGGGNAVTRMIKEGLQDVEFIAINTDAQVLKESPAGVRLQIGAEVTGGLGSGAKPDVGRKSAMEDKEQIAACLAGADMVFITAGLGGGTGTGAAPVVAEVARDGGALTVGIVTMPFSFEGKERAANARKGLGELEEAVDTLIVVPNDNVAKLCQNNVSLLDAFRQADEVLHNGVRAISELIMEPGLVNLDFADVRTIMQLRGRALMGIGSAEGENRAIRAAQEAIVCPLLEQSTIQGSTGVIVKVKGGRDLSMSEVYAAVSLVQENAEEDANVIFGVVVGETERPDVQITVIATGFRAIEQRPGESPLDLAVAAAAAKTTAEPPAPITGTGTGGAPAVNTEDTKEPGNKGPETKTPVQEEPVITYLFPEDDMGADPEPTPVDDDDFGIPAYMRRKKITQ